MVAAAGSVASRRASEVTLFGVGELLTGEDAISGSITPDVLELVQSGRSVLLSDVSAGSRTIIIGLPAVWVVVRLSSQCGSVVPWLPFGVLKRWLQNGRRSLNLIDERPFVLSFENLRSWL